MQLKYKLNTQTSKNLFTSCQMYDELDTGHLDSKQLSQK